MNTNVMTEWLQNLRQWTHLSQDALMIYSGLLLFFFVALCHQRQLKSNYAIWAVAALALAIELFGARYDILERGYWRIGDSLRGMLHMCLMPALLWLSAHYRLWKW